MLKTDDSKRRIVSLFNIKLLILSVWYTLSLHLSSEVNSSTAFTRPTAYGTFSVYSLCPTSWSPPRRSAPVLQHITGSLHPLLGRHPGWTYRAATPFGGLNLWPTSITISEYCRSPIRYTGTFMNACTTLHRIQTCTCEMILYPLSHWYSWKDTP